jgi:hypothetical protein
LVTTRSANSHSGPPDTGKHVDYPQPSKAETPAATFDRITSCVHETIKLEHHTRQAGCDWYANKQQYQEAYAACLNNAASEQAAIDKGHQRLRTCSPSELTPSGIFAATKTAAVAGDRDAQMCFVAANFLEDPAAGKIVSQEDESEYRRLAPGFIDSAFAQGDWRIVALLSRRSVDSVNRLLSSVYDIGTPETIYKMNRLLQLGGSEGVATGAANSLAKVELPAQQQSVAERWVRETYNAQFASTTRLEAMPRVCASPSDDE